MSRGAHASQLSVRRERVGGFPSDKITVEAWAKCLENTCHIW